MIAHVAPALKVSAPPYRIQQPIFHGRAAAHGARVVFASLTDGRCALLVNDRLVAAWGNDAYGIEVGVYEYLEMTGVTAQRIAARDTERARARTRSRSRSFRQKDGVPC